MSERSFATTKDDQERYCWCSEGDFFYESTPDPPSSSNSMHPRCRRARAEQERPSPQSSVKKVAELLWRDTGGVILPEVDKGQQEVESIQRSRCHTQAERERQGEEDVR